MRFVKLDTLDTMLHIQRRGSKLPNGAIQLLSRKSSACHRVQEISPRYLARLAALIDIKEQSVENFQCALVDTEDWLFVWLSSGQHRSFHLIIFGSNTFCLVPSR